MAREMAEETFLARLVVIGRDDQRAIHAQLLGRDRGGDGFARGVRAGAGETWQRPFAISTASRMTCSCSSCDKRRAFARRADGDDAGDRRRRSALDQLLERGGIDLAVTKWRDERRVGAAKHRVLDVRRSLRKRNPPGRSGSHSVNSSPFLSKLTLNSSPPRTSTATGRRPVLRRGENERAGHHARCRRRAFRLPRRARRCGSRCVFAPRLSRKFTFVPRGAKLRVMAHRGAELANVHIFDRRPPGRRHAARRCRRNGNELPRPATESRRFELEDPADRSSAA